jgi:uncharacterized protein
VIYLDTSVVAPFYWQEALSDQVEALLSDESDMGLSELVEVELCSALSRRVRTREISQGQARDIVAQFQLHLEHQFYRRIAVKATHYSLAKTWISRFETSLRSLDALHLAIASVNGVRLVTADQALAKSAVFFGVEVQLLTSLNG